MHELDQFRRTIRTRSGDLSAIDAGHGRVALFVHGVGTNALLWRHVIAKLQSERRCIAIDLPLHGHSPARGDQDYSMGTLAEMLEDVCGSLELTDIDLVANDTGGGVAQVFAARHSGRLATLSLTNCETHDQVPPASFAPTVWLARLGVLTLLSGFVVRRPALARKVMYGSGYEHPERIGLDVIQAYVEPLGATKSAARQFNRWLAEMNPQDLLAVEPQLRRLTVPTLVVWGTGDRIFHKRWAYWLKQTIPGVTEVVELEGARLFFPDERADELVGFLRRHWGVGVESRPPAAIDSPSPQPPPI